MDQGAAGVNSLAVIASSARRSLTISPRPSRAISADRVHQPAAGRSRATAEAASNFALNSLFGQPDVPIERRQGVRLQCVRHGRHRKHDRRRQNCQTAR